jgi:Cu+-exporting ATPase
MGALFPSGASLRFGQSPIDKLAFVKRLQQAGKRVMMVGDGLNDAGALRQSDAGVAVIEQTGAFSPASDVIVPAARVRDLPGLLRLSQRAGIIVRLCFGISALYNLAGITIAATGALSPLFSAVLMPLSSVSVVAFACGATRRAARQLGF